MPSFDTQIHVEEQIPVCPFCECALEGEVINGLHVDCQEQLTFELLQLEDCLGAA